MRKAERKEKLYVASLSGGKDSTAMVLRLIEEKYPLDLILFCDTGFEYYFLHYSPVRKSPHLEGKSGMSWAGPRNRWCTSRLKVRVIDKYLKVLKTDYEIVQYIGIAADEPQRIKEFCYPLVEWGMTEKDCLEYCYERGYDWGGLYELFSWVSCWCCPLQGLQELRMLRRYFPKLWNQLLDWESRLGETSGLIFLLMNWKYGSDLKKNGFRKVNVSGERNSPRN